MTPLHLTSAIGKWNSRLVGLATLGISTLASAPGLPDDLRAIGITVVAVAGVVMVALRDMHGRPEALHGLGVEHPGPGDIRAGDIAPGGPPESF
jgi:hypothetical protein